MAALGEAGSNATASIGTGNGKTEACQSSERSVAFWPTTRTSSATMASVAARRMASLGNIRGYSDSRLGCTMSQRYILLARHGKSDAYGRINEKKQPRIPLPYKDRPLSNNEKRKTGGVWETREVAAALRDECESPSGGDSISIAAIWNGTHGCTQESATILAEALGRQTTPNEKLNPENVRSLTDTTALATDLRRYVADSIDRNAILVVGHEPQLDRLQDVLCRHSIPLRNSEVVCIKVCGQSKGRLLWVLSTSGDEKTLLELKTEGPFEDGDGQAPWRCNLRSARVQLGRAY